jgi:putative phosphoribosyl transferase
MGSLRIISDSAEPLSGRIEAGQSLARELQELRGQQAVVLGIPRGGVVVAQPICLALEADLDLVLSHKLGAPDNPELAIGAVCEDGKLFVDESIASCVGADDDYIELEKTHQLQQMAHRVQQYRRILPKLPLAGRIVIVTDDGVATGATMQAALWAVRHEKPRKLIAALPVGPEETLTMLSEHADETICLKAPSFFSAISQFYLQFTQVEDEQLLEILEEESKRRASKRGHRSHK